MATLNLIPWSVSICRLEASLSRILSVCSPRMDPNCWRYEWLVVSLQLTWLLVWAVCCGYFDPKEYLLFLKTEEPSSWLSNLDENVRNTSRQHTIPGTEVLPIEKFFFKNTPLCAMSQRVLEFFFTKLFFSRTITFLFVLKFLSVYRCSFRLRLMATAHLSKEKKKNLVLCINYNWSNS